MLGRRPAGWLDRERLPGLPAGIWDDGRCARSARLAARLAGLQAHARRHIGYGVVPCEAGRGYATRALGLILPDASAGPALGP